MFTFGRYLQLYYSCSLLVTSRGIVYESRASYHVYRNVSLPERPVDLRQLRRVYARRSSKLFCPVDMYERQQVLLFYRLERARLFHRAIHPDGDANDTQRRSSQ